MRRMIVIALTLCLFTLAIPSGQGSAVAPEPCGLTTLESTLDYSGVEEGQPLKCGPGQKMVVRTKFVNAHKNRTKGRKPLMSMLTIADVQLADEESPLRAEWADKCEEHPATAAFRPHETMVPHLLNAHLSAANAIAERGSPILDQEFDFAIGLGDLADNNQYNEIRWIIDLFDGNKLVDPDSGDDGYHGFQSEPEGAPNAEIGSPVEGRSIMDLANEPFWAAGLRPNGRPLPWYSLPGNHDMKVQGTVPNDPAWRQTANAWAQGSLKFTDLPPDQQQKACEGGLEPEDFALLMQNPGAARQVPADENRHLLTREEWAQEHFTTTGIPKGHGYNTSRCKSPDGKLLERLCYSWDQGKFHLIGLDTNPHEGLESGNVDDPQFKWLERELIANSKTYFTDDGQKKSNPEGRNRLIAVFGHHPQQSMDNTETEGAHQAQELKKLLLRFPNVIMFANGHTHQNRIWGRKDKKLGTGYWEVNTSAIVDVPTQSRTIEVALNGDGTLSIFAVVFDAAISPNARLISWDEHDHTHEVDKGGKVNINESWLSSWGREVMFYDPQQDLTKIGTPKDRNVELLLKAPRWLR